jgi:hypothetical protein
MTLSPLDDFPVHQVALPIRHPATSDRNFYDRHDFNCHSGTDELMLIIGLGQYPNLGVTDAFALARHDTTNRVVRASRELGADRTDTTVGPFPRRSDRGTAQASGSSRAQRSRPGIRLDVGKGHTCPG